MSERPANQCCTDREDPCYRVDAGAAAVTNLAICHAWQLVGRARRSLFQSVRSIGARTSFWHSWLTDRTVCRPIFNYGGVHGGLSTALAHSRRLFVSPA